MPNTSNITLPFSKSHAFIIGINEYQNGISRLKTAVKDAKDIELLLRETHGYTTHVTYDSTKQQIQDLFSKMKTVVKDDDRVFFYFAGHGIAFDSEKDPEGFLVPADADTKNKDSLLPMNELRETLKALPCKHGLIVLDCCFAGSFKWSTGSRTLYFDTQEALYAERFARFVDNSAWQVITSSAHDQKAIDLLSNHSIGMRENQEENPEEDENFNSPFAWALKQAINIEGKADVVRGKRSDGVITASELYIYLREIVETASHKQGMRQSPAIFTLTKHDTKGEYIFLHPGHTLNLPPAPDQNPYKGLGAYTDKEEDVEVFFGRTKTVKAIVRKLAHTSILVVTAPSGTGKSSTLRAGVFPFLKQQEGYEYFHYLYPRMGEDEHWDKLSTLDLEKKRLVLVDQYEEIFNQSHAGEEKSKENTFEQKLLELLNRIQVYEENGRTSQVKIVLAIRSDFEWQLQTSNFGKSFWDDKQLRKFLYRLPPMTSDELKEAMVKPAWRIAYEFESEEFITRILEEINYSPGALPLLSFTLNRLYEFRDMDRRLFTQDAYENKLGGINGVLSKHADSVYESLASDAHREVMRQLILRMVRLNDGSYTRRRIYLKVHSRILREKGLEELNYPDKQDQIVLEVLEALIEQQLVRKDKDDMGEYIEPLHDSLINFWPRCLQWIMEMGRENLVLQRQLWQAVVEHHQWKPDAYSELGDEPPLWDNNPKLQQIQLAITDPRDVWFCQKGKGWEEKSISSMAYLLWTEKPVSTQLEDMISYHWYFEEDDLKKYDADYYADPPKIFQQIKAQMNNWLNEAELKFVKRSFEKQQTELERLKKQRDDAIRAKEEAEAARQRTVTEMIEASWKAGTYIEKPNDNWVRGVRDLYKRLKLIMSLKKAQSLSPVPIFLKGPHGEDFDTHADSFGYYNPAFLSWAKNNLIPARKDSALRQLTQPFYDSFMRDMARIYYLCYQYLEANPHLLKQVAEEYKAIVEGKVQNQTYATYGGGFFLQGKLRDYADQHEQELTNLLGEMAWYYWVVAAGFWVRRTIDGTAEDFKAILKDLLIAYDNRWVKIPPELPT